MVKRREGLYHILILHLHFRNSTEHYVHGTLSMRDAFKWATLDADFVLFLEKKAGNIPGFGVQYKAPLIRLHLSAWSDQSADLGSRSQARICIMRGSSELIDSFKVKFKIKSRYIDVFQKG